MSGLGIRFRGVLLALAAFSCCVAGLGGQSASPEATEPPSATASGAGGPRRLAEATKRQLAACLKKKPGRFSVMALAGDSESYSYARDWWEVLVETGWRMEKQDAPIETFHIAGNTWTGMRVNMHGDSPGNFPDQARSADNGSPQERFARCVEGRHDIPEGGRILRYKDRAAGGVAIQVSGKPK